MLVERRNSKNWQQMKLGDFVSLQRGYDLPEAKRKPGTVPVIGSFGITGYHDTAKAKGPGVTIGRSGASFGVVSYSQVNYWPHNASLFVTDFHGNDEKFVYYFLKSIDFKSYNSGSAQPSLNRNYIYQIDIEVPPYHTQKRIADILSAYDRLIENNTRRIKILEEMARSLYDEWFVKFRFPGHGQTKLINSELGLIPEDWRIKLLPQICSKVIDGTHDSPKPVEEGYCLVTGKHIINGFIDFSKCYFISPEEHEKVMKRSKPEKGDIIFSNIGTLGSTVLVDQSFEFSIKNVALFKPLQDIYSCFLYLYFSSPRTLQFLTQKASGTSQRFFSLQFLRNLEVLVPHESILVKFSELVSPALCQRSSLHRKNQNLRQTRDLLLPKLISGEIDMEKVGEIGEEGAITQGEGMVAV